VQLLEGEEVAAADWDEGSRAWELYLSSSGDTLRSSHVWLATGGLPALRTRLERCLIQLAGRGLSVVTDDSW
jgi:hypothetical protein